MRASLRRRIDKLERTIRRTRSASKSTELGQFLEQVREHMQCTGVNFDQAVEALMETLSTEKLYAIRAETQPHCVVTE